MKNITAPRTLAECQFEVGHAQANLQRRERAIDIAWWAAGVALVGFLVLIWSAM